jgi:glycosyltransferase involved in cell wall biosynthesis
MKILFVGDGSNYHITLAQALREMGHTAVVASNGGGWMRTDSDIYLGRKPGTAGGIKYLFDIIASLPKMRGFDVVQLMSTTFLGLRLGKLRLIFDYLKRENGRIFLSAVGSDYNYVKACYDKKLFRYSDYFIGDKPSPYALSPESAGDERWLGDTMRQYASKIVNGVDGIVASLYEYYAAYENVAPGKLAYGGIPINTKALIPHYIESTPDKVRFFIGVQRQRNALKGTDRLLAALQRVHDRFPDECDMTVVENLPYEEYVKKMLSSHVILDQLYSYTPATNALIAMAQGIVAVSGAEPEYYDFIGEKELHPIINVTPADEGDIDKKLEWIIRNKSRLPELSHQSREFVIRNNDSRLVAQRNLDFWNKTAVEP